MILAYVAEIAKHKGPPVFTEKERYKMVRAIKWVDEVWRQAYLAYMFVSVKCVYQVCLLKKL